MTTLNAIIIKQLLVKNLFDNNRCLDLQNEICEYLFLDKIQVEARKNKRILIECMNRYLDRFEDEDEENTWNIIYGYELQFRAIQCIKCGGYEFIGGPLLANIAPRALCCCPGYNEFYERQIALYEYYEQNIANQPLQMFM